MRRKVEEFLLELRQQNAPVVLALKAIKHAYRELVFRFYKIHLRLIRRLPNIRPRKKNSILITGDAPWGVGPYFFLINLCKALRIDYEVLLSFPSDQIAPSLAQFCKDEGFRIIRRPPLPDALDLFATELVARATGASLLLVNAPLFSRSVHLLASGTPTLYYSHSIWHRDISEKVAWTFKTFLDRKHKVITVSQSAYDSLSENYFEGRNSEHLRWIYNWVPDRQNTPKRLATLRETTVVLTLGTVASYKNPELWIRIAKRVLARSGSTNNIEFWWAGTGPLLETAVRLAGDDARIKFIGFEPDTATLYSGAAVYFQPSEFESFGLAVCEAMMHGLPCVVTDCGGPAELVQNETNGYVLRESDEDLMVEKILDLVQDNKKRTEMGRLSRNRYLDLFTEDRWRDGFNKIVEEVAAQGLRKPHLWRQ